MAQVETSEMLDIGPPEKYDLKCFLLKVGDMLDDSDFKRLKYLCRGNDGIGKRSLELMDTPLDLFDFLIDQEKISENNIIYLQSLLWQVGCKNVFKTFVEYARERNTTLYIHPPKESPENGYKYIKFHIKGDTGKYNQKQLQKLHIDVAKLLCIPPEYIFIGGVQRSKSLLVTFMIPEQVVFIFEELTEREKSELYEIGVDFIDIENKKINLNETKTQSDESTQQLSDIEQENIELHDKVLKTQHEIDILQTHLAVSKKQMEKAAQGKDYLQRIGILYLLYFLYRCRTSWSTRKIPSCKTLSAQAASKMLLQKCREKRYDTDIVQQLLDANAILIREDFISRQSNKEDIIMQENVHLQYEISKLKFYHGMKQKDSSLSQRDEFFIYNLLRGVTMSVDVDVNHPIFTAIYELMSKHERLEVQKNANLTAKEVRFLKQKPHDLLEMLYAKECMIKNSTITIHGFLQQILQPLNNDQLMQKAFALIGRKYTPSDDLKPSSSKSTKTSSKQQRGKKEKRKEKHHTGNATTPSREEPDISDCDSGYGERDDKYQELKAEVRTLINVVNDFKSKIIGSTPFPKRPQWVDFAS